ncbi:uncharacterized protein with beta-barrel porin domain [Rhodoblastus acidophilus]|nr:autotransporter domain-containing protein [Rhodoblastus acidophilus]MCW2272920.1 uncharacterized protein with beta-barrel porin domain [Rhodoblastus acidophilus]
MNTSRPLLACCSLSAILIGGGAPAALAQSLPGGCYAGPFPHSNAAAIHCIQASGISVAGDIANEATGAVTPGSPLGVGILVRNAAVSGSVANAGVIAAPTGVSLVNARVAGSLSSSGTISGGVGLRLAGATVDGGVVSSGTVNATSAGILIDAGSAIRTDQPGVLVSGPTLLGGISNAGTISARQWGVVAAYASTFSGGVKNSGAITATMDTVNGYPAVGVAAFNSGAVSGGLSNAKTGVIAVTAAVTASGISVWNVSSFSGGMSNAGVISVTEINAGGRIAGAAGLDVGSYNTGSGALGGSLFTGGIANSGWIDVVVFNSGVITGGAAGGLSLHGVSTFTGGVVNSRDGVVIVDFTNDVGGTSVGAAGLGVRGTRATALSTNTARFEGGVLNAGTIGVNVVNRGTVAFGLAGVAVKNFVSSSGGVSNEAGGRIAVEVANTGAGGNIYGVGVGGPVTGSSAISIETYAGGVSNAGVIAVTASNAGTVNNVAGVSVSNVSRFDGGLTNSGGISVAVSGPGAYSGDVAGLRLAGVANWSGAVVNSGAISAPVGIDIGANVGFAAGSSIVNTGTIIGSVAAIDASAATSPVTISQAGGLLSGAVKLSAHADTLTVSGGTLAGDIVGQGAADTVNFAPGPGRTFTYGAPYGFSGVNQVNVASGTLTLNGANSATNVTVAPGAKLEVGDAAKASARLTSAGVDVFGVLAGHGAVSGPVKLESGATLAPGGSVGALTVNGDVAFASGATYAIALSPTAASKTQVNGAAILGGATVSVTPGVLLGAHAAQTFTILTATAGLRDTFNPAVSVTQSGLMAAPNLGYDAKNVFLNIPAYIRWLDLAPAAPRNAISAANALNGYFLTGATPPAPIQGLGALSGAALNAAVNQVAGQQQGAAEPLAIKAGDLFLSLMLDPHADGRGAAAGSAMPSAEAPIRDGAAFQSIAPTANSPVFWAGGYGGGASYAGDAASGAARNVGSIYGYAAGADYRVEPNAVVGVAIGGGGTAFGLGQGRGGGSAQMVQAGVYGALHSGPAYVTGGLAFTAFDFATNRSLAGVGTQRGAFKAGMVSNRLEAGYAFPVYAALSVTPYAANQIQGLFLPGFGESFGADAAFSLNYGGRDAYDDRVELGARFDLLQPAFSSGLKIYGRLAWAHNFYNLGLSSVSFASFSAPSFLVCSAAPARDSALVTAGAEYSVGDGWTVSAKFEGEFARTANFYGATGQIRKAW